VGGIDYLQALHGASIIQGTISQGGSATYLDLKAAPGADKVAAQKIIDMAVRATPASVPLYGMTLKGGGSVVITPPSAAAIAAYKPTASTAPITSASVLAARGRLGF
jgi:hypothetical protein